MSVYWWLVHAWNKLKTYNYKQSFPEFLLEIALNDKEGGFLDEESNLSWQETVPPGAKRIDYDFIDYMLLKMYWEPG